jgi:hypothetical protein
VSPLVRTYDADRPCHSGSKQVFRPDFGGCLHPFGGVDACDVGNNVQEN